MIGFHNFKYNVSLMVETLHTHFKMHVLVRYTSMSTVFSFELLCVFGIPYFSQSIRTKDITLNELDVSNGLLIGNQFFFLCTVYPYRYIILFSLSLITIFFLITLDRSIL